MGERVKAHPITRPQKRLAEALTRQLPRRPLCGVRCSNPGSAKSGSGVCHAILAETYSVWLHRNMGLT